MLLKYDVEQTPELRIHSFAIKKHGAPTLRLAADTEDAATRWITVIREAVERNNQVYAKLLDCDYSSSIILINQNLIFDR